MITIDMKMPTDCNSCLIRKIMGCKIANESGWLNIRRDERCLLKEVVMCKDCFYGEVAPDDNSYFFCTHPLHKLESHESHYYCADGNRNGKL